MEGPSATLALVLAETAVGGSALLWLGRVWGQVRRGFFVLTGATMLAAALLATMAAASTGAPTEAIRLVVVAGSVTSGLLALSVCALMIRADAAGRLLGLLSVPAGVGMLVALAAVTPTFVPSLLQLLAGAAFLGAVADGLLLGHWYLTDRRLSRDHIKRFAVVVLVAVGLEALSLAVLGFGESAGAAEFSVILGISGLTTWVALGMVACTALVAFLIRASLRGDSSRAVQGATGFFYLAVITAFTAEMAAKVGFLG